MKSLSALLAALLLTFGMGLSAQADLDGLFAGSDEAAAVEDEAVAVEVPTEEAVVVEEEAVAVEAVVEEVAAEVAVPTPAPVPEPVVEQPVAEAAVVANDGPAIGHRLMMWLPNLLVDLDDSVSFALGFGTKLVVESRVTQYCQLFGTSGDHYFLAKDFGRQYGGGYGSSWALHGLCWTKEKGFVEDEFGTVKNCLYAQEVFALPSSDQDLYRDGLRDRWAIGAGAGWLVNVAAHFHPVEFADFLTGIVLYDLTGDNF